MNMKRNQSLYFSTCFIAIRHTNLMNIWVQSIGLSEDVIEWRLIITWNPKVSLNMEMVSNDNDKNIMGEMNTRYSNLTEPDGFASNELQLLCMRVSCDVVKLASLRLRNTYQFLAYTLAFYSAIQHHPTSSNPPISQGIPRPPGGTRAPAAAVAPAPTVPEVARGAPRPPPGWRSAPPGRWWSPGPWQWIPSENDQRPWLLKMVMVDLSSKKYGDFPYVSLPEGNFKGRWIYRWYIWKQRP